MRYLGMDLKAKHEAHLFFSLEAISDNVFMHLHFNCNPSCKVTCETLHWWHPVRVQKVSDLGFSG